MKINEFAVWGCLLLAGQAGAQVDCLGVNGGSALPGTPCDDLNFYSIDDTWDASCNCVGILYDCNWDQFGTGWPGTICEDGNPFTINDVFHYPCNCSGTCPGCDCFGTLGGPYLPGTPCDDLHPATVFDTFQSNCDCMGQQNFIYGQVFLDLNMDGVMDLGEPTIANRTVQITPGNFQGTSGLSGAYLIVAGLGTYDINAAPGSFDMQSGPLPPVTFGITGQNSWGNNIPMTASTMQGDLSVAISAERTRPGFDNAVTVTCKNEGTIPIGGTVSITFDPLQSYVSSAPPGTLVGSTLSWNVPVLGLGETTPFEVVLNTPATTPLLTPIQHSATVVAAPPDAVPANDTYIFNDVVVGSWDPNDKLVSNPVLTPQQVAAGTPLTFTIRFQNTGTWLAEDVRISDTLSAQLDLSTMEFIGSSHPVQWSISNSVLGILYDQIMLPDSGANEPESHGFFQFRITPHGTLQLGDSISNSAAIYFDFNEPIITEPALTVVDVGAHLPELGSEMHSLRVWPNPAAEKLFLQMPAMADTRVWIVTTSGQMVVGEVAPLSKGGDQVAFDISPLAAGAYILKVASGGYLYHTRFVKLPVTH